MGWWRRVKYARGSHNQQARRRLTQRSLEMIGCSVEYLEERLVLAADTDDTFAEAVSLPPLLSGMVRAGAITVDVDDASDVDLYKFQVTAGQRLAFDLDRVASSKLDSHLRLWAFDAQTGEYAALAENSQGAAFGETLAVDPYLEYQFLTSGQYFVAIAAQENQDYSPQDGTGDVAATTSGGYQLAITDLDPDDQLHEITPLGVDLLGKQFQGELNYGADVDLLAINVAAGQTVAIDVDHEGSLNSLARLFNSTGAQIGSSDNTAAPGELLSSEPYLQYTFATAGTFYIGLSSSGNNAYAISSGKNDKAGATTGSYTVTVESLDADDALAESVVMGIIPSSKVRSGRLEVPWDVDLVKITASAGQTFAFDVDRATGSTVDTLLRIFDAAGSELIRNDDGVAPGEALANGESFLEYTFWEGGEYYLGLSVRGNGEYSLDGSGDLSGASTGSYVFTMSTLDEDDQLGEATELGDIAVGLSQSGALTTFSDVDLFKFTVPAGQRLAVDVDSASGGVDTFIRLFNSTGAVLASNDNGRSAGEVLGKDSYMEYRFLTAGTYFVGVSAAANAGYNVVTGLGDAVGGQGEYELHLLPIDPDDQLTEAVKLGPIVALRERAAAIEVPADVDLYAFTVSAGQRVSLDIDLAADSRLDSFVRLFAASGEELANNDNGSAADEVLGLESYLEYSFATAGNYYVSVSALGNENFDVVDGTASVAGLTSGGYTIRIAPLDEDDQFSEARELGAPDDVILQAADWDSSIDVDLYKIDVMAGQILSFDIDHAAGTAADSYLRLFNAAGQVIAVNDNGAGPGEKLGKEAYLTATMLTNGTHYVGVSLASNRSYIPATGLGDVTLATAVIGNYTLQVVPQDSDDALAEAVVLPTVARAVRRAGAVENKRDVDMFKFTVPAGVTLGFDVDREADSSFDSLLRVFAADGREVAQNDNGVAPGETAQTGESFVAVTFAAAGTYFVAVTGRGNSTFDPVSGRDDEAGSTGNYALRIERLPRRDGFQIKLNTSGITSDQFAVLQEAAEFWSSVIVGDLPDEVHQGEWIDDLVIDVGTTALDGGGRLWAESRPTVLRAGSQLPLRGNVRFDSADVDELARNGQLLAVAVREIGYVLGFGTLWAEKGLLSGAGSSSDPQFVGAQAVAAYNRLFGKNAKSVPVESRGRNGVRELHWRDTVFGNELMSTYLNDRNTVTELTLASLADLGYEVDVSRVGREF